MSNIFITILSLSVSGSLLALVLFAGKPLLKNRVSKAFAYYIWLLVLLRLILPIAAPVNVVGTLFSIQRQSVAVTGLSKPPAVAEQAVSTSGHPQNASPETRKRGTIPSQASAGEKPSRFLWNWTKAHVLWIWLAGAVMSFGWFMAAYVPFAHRIRRSCVPPHPADLAVFRKMSRDQRIRLACSSYVTTPMLIGVLRPMMILPQLAYVQNAMENELKNILRHELTHYRRKDVQYKWLIVAVTSLHWFNPLMPLIRREIGRACELSCDEAVISKLPAGEKRQYGNTLLTFSAGGRLPAGILATTLSEGKAELKERLVSIMNYHKKSTWAVALTLVLTLLLAGCAATLGAENGSGNNGKSSGSSALPSGSEQSSVAGSDTGDQKNADQSSSVSSGGSADAAVSTTPNSTAQKWTQLDRLHYTEGSVQLFQKNADGTGTLSLKITKNYHSDTDPVDDPDSPFSVGTTQSFTLQTDSEETLREGADVVIYDCNVSPQSDPDKQFAGAVVLYYKKDGKYVDGNGKEAGMPPEDYPEFQDVFQ